MWHKRSETRSRLLQIFGLMALGGMALIVYQLQLQYTNAYMGFLPIDISGTYLFSALFFSVLFGMFLPVRISQPSDIFVVFYAAFVILSYVFFYAGALDVGITAFMFRLFITAFPFVVVRLLGSVKWRLSIPLDLKPETLLAILVSIAVSGVVVALYSVGSSGGFSIIDAYDRRMEGRDIFQAGSLVAYLNVMSMNGINPFIAFLGGLLNRKVLGALALGCSLVFFYTIGVKAPIAFVGLAYLVGFGIRTQNLAIFFNMIVLLTIILFAGFLVEFSANGRSEIAEYFFRRVYVIPGFDVQRYMTLIYERGFAVWSPLRGIQSDLSVTYLVGATFFGSDQANVNTNAFVYAIAAGGYLGYAAIVFGVAAFFKILDALYQGSGNPGYLYIGFLYAILLAEQAATTAFVSSGVGLLFFLVVLSGRGWHPHIRALTHRRGFRPMVSA